MVAVRNETNFARDNWWINLPQLSNVRVDVAGKNLQRLLIYYTSFALITTKQRTFHSGVRKK